MFAIYIGVLADTLCVLIQVLCATVHYIYRQYTKHISIGYRYFLYLLRCNGWQCDLVHLDHSGQCEFQSWQDFSTLHHHQRHQHVTWRNGLSIPRGTKEFGSLEVKGSFPRPEIFPWWKKRRKVIMYVDGLVVAGKPMPQTWSASWIWTTRRLSMDQLDEVSSRVESQKWWENFKENISFWDWIIGCQMATFQPIETGCVPKAGCSEPGGEELRLLWPFPGHVCACHGGWHGMQERRW